MPSCIVIHGFPRCVLNILVLSHLLVNPQKAKLTFLLLRVTVPHVNRAKTYATKEFLDNFSIHQAFSELFAVNSSANVDLLVRHASSLAFPSKFVMHLYCCKINTRGQLYSMSHSSLWKFYLILTVKMRFHGISELVNVISRMFRDTQSLFYVICVTREAIICRIFAQRQFWKI